MPEEGNYLFASDTLAWAAFFHFSETGYVKDDEKIDPDALLAQLKKLEGVENKERQRLGMPQIYNEGWEVVPHYDAQTKRLEWGIRIRTENGNQSINYTSRLLGRTGVMSAVLVTNPQDLAKNMPDFRKALEQYDFVSGERYAEFKAGDRVAEYGLAALIVGSAAVVASK